jgi:lipopolysaccharide/colanic/teichoic acid biosynthesis glycosyltransferase
MTPAGRALKRATDVAAAAVLLGIGWPALLVIAVLVRRDSPGPALFRQERAGRGMKPFPLYKFRTMRADADAFGASPKGSDDPRLTRLGRWLRETSLDELPQLWNVLKGDMSLVGPRPLYMSQAREFTPRQRRRLEVRPGITGLAQVTGRGELPHEERLEVDVQYVERAGVWLDLKILCRTAARALRRKSVYQRWD